MTRATRQTAATVAIALGVVLGLAVGVLGLWLLYVAHTVRPVTPLDDGLPLVMGLFLLAASSGWFVLMAQLGRRLQRTTRPEI